MPTLNVLSPLTRFGIRTSAFLAALLVGAPALAGDLPAFLERAERMATVNEAVEAEVTITEADGSVRRAHLALNPANGGTLVFEEPALGWKSTTPLDWKAGEAVVKTGATPAPFGVDDPLAGTDLRGIDFFPFWKCDYSLALMSDANGTEQTVSMFAAKGRPYTLYVMTFDIARLSPTMTKYYQDTFSNLTRIRTDEDLVMVGSRVRPQKITVRDFATNTTRTYGLVWKVSGS